MFSKKKSSGPINLNTTGVIRDKRNTRPTWKVIRRDGEETEKREKRRKRTGVKLYFISLNSISTNLPSKIPVLISLKTNKFAKCGV